MEAKRVNEVFNNLKQAFYDLAAIEDDQEALTESLSDFVPNSNQAKKIQGQIQELRPKLIEAQRKYRIAAMEVDRTRMLIEVEELTKK